MRDYIFFFRFVKKIFFLYLTNLILRTNKLSLIKQNNQHTESNMFSTLTLTPCDSHTATGEWPEYRSCSTDTFGDDNGPYLTSPQYKKPPPSPKPGNSVKLGDGRTITITALRISPLPAGRRREIQVCSDDIPSPPPPSLFRQLIDAFIRLPPQIFQRP